LTFLEKITAQHGKHNYFERAKTMRTAFAVKHYAGDVAYEVEGFLDKNRDTLQPDLLALVLASKTKLVGGTRARFYTPIYKVC
jgi:myosin heavy subunit